MFSKKTLTTLLVVAILALSYQTYTLVDLNQKLEQVQIGLGSSSAVNFSDTGGTPDMVGGC